MSLRLGIRVCYRTCLSSLTHACTVFAQLQPRHEVGLGTVRTPRSSTRGRAALRCSMEADWRMPMGRMPQGEQDRGNPHAGPIRLRRVRIVVGRIALSQLGMRCISHTCKFIAKFGCEEGGSLEE